MALTPFKPRTTLYWPHQRICVLRPKQSASTVSLSHEWLATAACAAGYGGSKTSGVGAAAAGIWAASVGHAACLPASSGREQGQCRSEREGCGPGGWRGKFGVGCSGADVSGTKERKRYSVKPINEGKANRRLRGARVLLWGRTQSEIPRIFTIGVVACCRFVCFLLIHVP